mgnify:CR=1 FL=1
MKIADVQILFYAIDSTANDHEIAARWFEDAINASEPLGLTWSTIHRFLRLRTNAAFSGDDVGRRGHSLGGGLARCGRRDRLGY